MQTLRDNPKILIDQPIIEPINNTPTVDMIALGIVTGVAATAIMQVGKGVLSTLTKNPIFLLGAGIATGYFSQKYRKEILTLSTKAADQSIDFVKRQEHGIKKILHASQQTTEGE
jgi:hypothetical protein